MNDKKLQKAIDYYTGMGWAIFPVHSITAEGHCSCGKTDCKSQGKHPRTANGFKDATNVRDAAHNLFQNHPGANIGVATGAVSGIWVLDVDGERGLADLNTLETRCGQLPKTPVAATGGGGKHFFFSTTGETLQNSTRIAGGLSIDVRGNGGYVVVPPSDHLSGDPYQWSVRPDEIEPAQALTWLIHLVTADTSLTSLTPGSNKPTFQVLGDLVHQGRFGELPGVPEGQRHNTALHWVGHALSQGMPSQAILDLGKTWCLKCNPPMKWREFTRIVDDLAARDEKKRMEGVSFHPIEEQQKVVLGDDAYYGVLGDIVNKIRPETESDPAALLVQFLVMVGNMIGRGPFYVADGSKHHTNLFSVIVGRTSGARKGTSLGWVKRICGKVDSNFCGTAVKTGLTSGEGIIYHVRDPNAATGDAGTADKRMMLIETEFSAVLAAMRRRDNTLSPTLRAAWDDGTLATLSKNNPVRATGAHVSLIAHITVEELMLCLGQVERFNGFANRLLWCHADRAKVMPFGGRDVDYSDLTVQLRAAIDVAENVEEVVLADSAKSLWEEFYHAAAEPKSGLYGAVTDRAEAQTIRLAMIYALLDRSQVIERVHLKAAIALWNYCESTAGCVFDGQTTRTLHDRILNVIKRSPDGIDLTP